MGNKEFSLSDIQPLVEEVGNLLILTIENPPVKSAKGNESPANFLSGTIVETLVTGEGDEVVETPVTAAQKLHSLIYDKKVGVRKRFGNEFYFRLTDPEENLFTSDEERAEIKELREAAQAELAEAEAALEAAKQVLKEKEQACEAIEMGCTAEEFAVNRLFKTAISALQRPESPVPSPQNVAWTSCGLKVPKFPQRGRKPAASNGSRTSSNTSDDTEV